jgi:PucR family transcriptional regulator, purine catabolism regulatory protein
MPQANLRDLLKSVLPAATRYFADGDLATRQVDWVVVLPSEATIDRVARRNDLVLLNPPYSDDLPASVTSLAASGVAALALAGTPAPGVIDAATNSGVPLCILPADADLRAIERQALTWLIDKDAALAQHANQIYDRLVQMSAEGVGLNAMAAELARASGKIVLIQDKNLNPSAVYVSNGQQTTWHLLETELTNASALPESMRDRKRATLQSGPVRQGLAAGQERFIQPITVKGVARGFISMIANPSAFSALDVLLVEKCATAFALEMAKAKAVREMEKRVRGDFVDAILAGNLSRGEVSHWARRIGFPASGAYAAVALGWSSVEHPSLRRLETIVSGELRTANVQAHARARGDEIVIFQALDPERGVEPAQKLANRIHAQAAREFPHARLATGIGRTVKDMIALRDSYREAAQARSMGVRLGELRPLFFGHLSVYRLLFQLEDSPELVSFCEETLGSLIEYDKNQKTELLKTLSAYFAHQTNLSRTASAMHVHRNTLLYRMTRISEITHWDMNDSETRLAVDLALRAYRLLKSDNKAD